MEDNIRKLIQNTVEQYDLESRVAADLLSRILEVLAGDLPQKEP